MGDPDSSLGGQLGQDKGGGQGNWQISHKWILDRNKYMLTRFVIQTKKLMASNNLVILEGTDRGNLKSSKVCCRLCWCEEVRCPL